MTVTTGGGTLDPVEGTLTWVVDQLLPGASLSFTFSMSVDDISLRPYRNLAEITADSADDYDAGGIDGAALLDVEDADSTPDAVTTNDGSYGPIGDSTSRDNTGPDAIDRAGVGTDAAPQGEDDGDVADVAVALEYDLALVKVLPAGPRYLLGDIIDFQIVVKNQGDVDSGAFSFSDVIPAGMTYVPGLSGGTASAGVVTFSIENLRPGETRTAVRLRLDDVTLSQYVNRAEIVSDSADDYSTATETVVDDDSTPDIDQILGDEDDHDVEQLDVDQVVADNTPAPVDIPLPRTGGDVQRTLAMALMLVSIGDVGDRSAAAVPSLTTCRVVCPKWANARCDPFGSTNSLST